MTSDEQDKALAVINAWCITRPGVIGPFADRKMVELEAFRLCRPAATMNFFITHIARAGYVIEQRHGGFLLDVSDPALILEAP
jgi:hypothetical protein